MPCTWCSRVFDAAVAGAADSEADGLVDGPLDAGAAGVFGLPGDGFFGAGFGLGFVDFLRWNRELSPLRGGCTMPQGAGPAAWPGR